MKRATAILPALVLAIGFGGWFPRSVWAGSQLLIAAGGGGGAGYDAANGGNGQITTAGENGFGSGGGAAGTNGLGGAGGTGNGGKYNGGGGAGWLGNGGNGEGMPPLPPQQGTAGDGGFGPPTFAGGQGGGTSGQFANGGFGGGGGGGYSGGGGGGGYSGGGGGGGADQGGGGGGSFIAPAFTGVNLIAGENPNNGAVTIDNSTFFDYTGRVVDYVIPTTGTYYITAYGAAGGGSENDIGGLGAIIGGNIALTAGTTLEIVVGGMGSTGNFDGTWAGGGGGGSFVFTSSIPEPSTLIQFALGMAGAASLACLRRRRAATVA